jgi:pimeloyl-ACP methyl ester carboxylesterase
MHADPRSPASSAREHSGACTRKAGGKGEGVPITRIHRRRFLAGAAAIASGCTGGGNRAPPLDELYDGARSHEQPPLIVIPGAFGSRLVDTRSGRELWPGSAIRMLLDNYAGLEVEIDEATLEPRSGVVEASAVFRQGLGRDFYGQVLDTLEGPGGYRRRRPGEPVDAGQRNYYVYLYDWRLDNVAAVAGLHELIQRVRPDYGDSRLRFDIVAHSNGGLLARYYARFGAVDRLAGGPSEPTYAGAPAIERLVLVGTPNLGTMQPVLAHVRGEEMGLRRVPREIVATTSGATQLMPHPVVPWLVDRHGDVIDVDAFDIATWREFRWSIFDSLVRARTIERKGGGATGRRYLSMLETYLEKHLARGRRFMQLLSQRSSPRDVRPYVFGGDCEPTVARLVVEETRGGRQAHERGDTVGRPEPDIDYDGLIHDPGDGVVTRHSLLGDYSGPLRTGFSPIPAMPVAQSMFLCERHQHLTGNRIFQNNVLHTLLTGRRTARLD